MRKGENKRQAILDVAEKLFYAKGYDATSIQDLLDVLGTSKGSFYHHFESKEALLATLCDQRVEAAARKAEEAMTATEDALEQLNILLTWMTPVRTGEQRFLSLLLPLLEKAEGLPVRVGLQRAIRETFAPLLQKQLTLCAAAEAIHVPDSPYLAEMICALMDELWLKITSKTLASVHRGESVEPAALVDMVNLYRYALESILNARLGSLTLVDVMQADAVLKLVVTNLNIV